MSKKRNRPPRPRQGPPAPGSSGPGSSGAGERAEAADPKAEKPEAETEAETEAKAEPEAKAEAATKAAPAKPASAAPAKPAPAAPAKLPPAPEPQFWFGFEVAWAKLALARVVLFTLLAIDAFLQIRHAPRYGAGDFNVAHLPFLDGLAPGRTAYEVGQLALTYLFVLTALGVATRLVLPIAAVLFGWLYFGSQLDSYQHHYLVALLVGIACFVPWQRPPDAAPGTPVRTWAVRLILVQLGIMYLWAAISKMDPAWASGRTLGGQLTGSLRSAIDHTIGIQAASIIVIAVELALAGTIWLRPTWKIAAPLGLLFHLGIAQSGLEIGLFAYLMLGLYVLAIPDGLIVRLADTPAVRSLRAAVHRVTRATSWPLLALALAAGIGAGALLRLEHGLAAALAVSALPVGLAAAALVRGRAPGAALGAAHLAAFALWLAADRASSVAVDYYKFWAGSQRRFGDVATAEHAYRRLTEVAPDLELGHYYLGRILVADGRGDEGVAHLREAQRLEPGRARAWMEEARYLAAQGKHDDAVAKARQAAFAEPSNREARALLETLIANRPAPAGRVEDDTEKL